MTVAGDPTNWNQMAETLDDAKFAVWSVDPDDYWPKTVECLDRLNDPLHGTDVADDPLFLDVGCGVGRLTIAMLCQYPRARAIGYDVAEKMLAHAADEAAAGFVGDRAVWVQGDGRTIRAEGVAVAWSVVTFQHNPRDVCADLTRAVADALRPRGLFVYQVVSDRDVSDECHVSDETAAEWATNAGLDVRRVTHGDVFPDWTFVEARKP